MAERACLESMCTRKGTAGSNPALSAKENRTVNLFQIDGFYFLALQVYLYKLKNKKRHWLSPTVLFSFAFPHYGISEANPALTAKENRTVNLFQIGGFYLYSRNVLSYKLRTTVYRFYQLFLTNKLFKKIA